MRKADGTTNIASLYTKENGDQKEEKEKKIDLSTIKLNAKSLTIEDKPPTRNQVSLSAISIDKSTNNGIVLKSLQVPGAEYTNGFNSQEIQDKLVDDYTVFDDVLDKENYEGVIGDNARKSSLTNMAISSSIAASLIGVSPQVIRKNPDRGFHSETNSVCTSISDDTVLDEVVVASGGLSARRKSRLPLLRLHMPQPHSWSNFISGSADPEELKSHNGHHHHHHYHFPHIPVPTITFTSDGSGRKFSIGIRRHSQTVSPGY